MRVLIVEDDFTSRLMIQKILQPYGEVHIAVDGDEALEAFQLAWQEQAPYELICLDIMLPKMDGQEVLKQIRNLESQRGIGGRDSVKIIMISALSDKKNILEAFRAPCEAYLIKPLEKSKLLDQVRSFGLMG